MNQQSLVNLFDRYKHGDRNSLELLCKNAEQFMRGYFKHKFTNIDLVNELCQETFIRLMSSMDQINEPVKFKNFVLKIAFHVTQDYFRQKYRSNTIGYFEDDQSTETHSQEIISESDDPDAVIRKIDMENALAALPEKAQEILQLYSEGFKLNEIAENFGLSESAVKMQVKRSLEKLKITLFLVTFFLFLRL
jgi:RNA polymerase sigma-70 factor, ECF subfamily